MDSKESQDCRLPKEGNASTDTDLKNTEILRGKTSSVLIDAIRERISDKGLNQKQAAKLLGISESRVSDILNGRRKINLNIAKRLRDNFGVSIDFILDNM